MTSDMSVVGCLGLLLVATRGPHGPGEVLVRIRGGSETFIAYSDEPLPRGETVLITDIRGGRVVDVIQWDAPLT